MVFVESLEFSIQNIMSSEINNDNFASFFPIWMPFIYLFNIIAMARTSDTLLDESEHPCLVPAFELLLPTISIDVCDRSHNVLELLL